MIIKTIPVGPYATNCFIVGSESSKKGMIIDPGSEARMILDEIKRQQFSIELIVVTHSHFDHVGALKAVQDVTGAKVALHHKEVEGLGQAVFQALGGIMSGTVSKPIKPGILLNDGDSLTIGELRFTVLFTPGHSPGGISILGDGVVFCGDTLFNFSIGRTDFPGCSHAKLIESITKKLMVLPDETKVFPGHGLETTIGVERRMNPFLQG